MTERFLLLFKTLRTQVALLPFWNAQAARRAVQIDAAPAQVVADQLVVFAHEFFHILAHLLSMGRIARRAQGADNNDLLALHAVNQVNRIVVCRAMITPVGQHEGIEQIDHFLVDIADVIGADVVGRGRLGQAKSIAGDGGKNDGDFIHERVILSCSFH